MAPLTLLFLTLFSFLATVSGVFAGTCQSTTSTNVIRILEYELKNRYINTITRKRPKRRFSFTIQGMTFGVKYSRERGRCDFKKIRRRPVKVQQKFFRRSISRVSGRYRVLACPKKKRRYRKNTLPPRQMYFVDVSKTCRQATSSASSSHSHAPSNSAILSQVRLSGPSHSGNYCQMEINGKFKDRSRFPPQKFICCKAANSFALWRQWHERSSTDCKKAFCATHSPFVGAETKSSAGPVPILKNIFRRDDIDSGSIDLNPSSRCP